MRSGPANGLSRLHHWLRVRDIAVPPQMISTATTRREIGDWSGACSAAHFDVDLNLRSLARTHGRACAAAVRTDLRHLAPDLLRWHLPRIGPDGLLRPGLTISLARYHPGDAAGHQRGSGGLDGAARLHLVVRTPPAWAAGLQRISLGLWHRAGGPPQPAHPHPAPDRRFRLDLHRHLWDARHSPELAQRSGAGEWAAGGRADAPYARHRWIAEAHLLLHADGRAGRQVAVRLGTRRPVVLTVPGPAPDHVLPLLRSAGDRGGANVHDHREMGQRLPVLPDAATWVLPDLELLQAGLIDSRRLHPLVAAALTPAALTPAALTPATPARPDAMVTENPGAETYLVGCGGHQHRIRLVDGVYTPLDHAADDLRREDLLAALGGPVNPCLSLIDQLDQQARNRAGQRITYGLYRAGLTRFSARNFVPETSHPHGDAA